MEVEQRKKPFVQVFKPRFSIAGWLSSLGLLAAFSLVFWFCWVGEKSLYFLFVIAMILVVGFLLVTLFLLIIYPTMRYEMRQQTLNLICGPFNWMVPYSEIKEISKTNLKYHPSSTGWKLPGYAIGRIYYADRGDVWMCSTGMCRDITLIKTQRSLFGITPRDEEAFAEALKERMKQ